VIALLYDIHGNLPALEAVLADAADRGAERFVLGGDYTLFGAWPAEVLYRLEALPEATWIRGNGERWIASPADAPDTELVQQAIRACAAALGARRVRSLAELAEQAVIDETRLCHGSPISDVRSFFPEPAEDEEELLAGIDERRLVFGHTHVPFARSSSAAGRSVELVNPGSVGMPFDGDARAAYALLAPDEGRVEHRRVDYDHRSSAAAVRALGGSWTETVARRIEAARPDVG
jgi:predicted phosphodiesterase